MMERLGKALAQITIKAKVLGLIVLGALTSIVIGTVGISNTAAMNDLTVNMHDNQLMPVNWVAVA
ncbi:MCP four helix bundle domain-containing protein, partial [Chromobacterium haemolyticum]|uniref:MCP four helix bundle domain-containing protein n=1 Tax=Chromobacterium haemolyticum TaxID=394935 RepID=UPI00405742DB